MNPLAAPVLTPREQIEAVLKDAELAGQLEAAARLAAEIAHRWPAYRTLSDGCIGDTNGLREALGSGYVVVEEQYDDLRFMLPTAEDCGLHVATAIFQLLDGRIIRAECDGCSCTSSGSWEYAESVAAARRLNAD